MTLAERYTIGDAEHVALRLVPCQASRPDAATLSPTPVPVRAEGIPRRSPTNLMEAIQFYGEHHVPVTPVRPGDKKGYKAGWSTPGHGATLAEFRADDNVGVLNGTEPEDGWYFHDVDIDANSDVARRIVERLLPPTGWRYGHVSKPRSHANYLIQGQLRTRKYLGSDNKSILELRGISQKRTYTLSVGPGSTWSTTDKREPIRFSEPRGAIGRIATPDDFDRDVQHAAVGIVIGQCWPATNRHRLRLAFAKVLLDHGLSAERSTTILEAVMDATGSDVRDVADTVRDTADAMRTDHAAGASVVVEVLGDELGRAVLSAIGRILRAHPVDDADGVVMRGGDLSAIVDRIEGALLSHTIFQRGGVLTRPIKLDRAIGDTATPDVRRDAGTTMLIAVREPWLTETMGRTLRWYKATKDGALSPADPAPLYARTLLSRAEWRFPVLRGVVTAPTLDRDGRIIETPGFDATSGLLVDIQAGSFPPIPIAPSQDDARLALARLDQPLRGFPFVDGAQSVARSALLTALIRVSLRTSPLHGFDAPTAGTGKSLLAEMVGLLATGFRPPALSQGKSDEEDEKRLATILFAGDPVIHIDNCEQPLAGDFLCSMLTQEIVQARILGYSERRVLPSTALVLASGNNLAFAGDTARRAVVCRLDAEVERPDTRVFDFDCHAEVLAHRPELVVAGLTILRAYHLAGRPTKLIPMGSFTDWEWIRGALVWLGCTDPADTRATILDNDPRKSDLLEVMDLWMEAIGTNTLVEVAEIDRRAEAYAVTEDAIRQRDLIKGLRTKLAEVACRGRWSGTSVGRWLNRHKDRVVDGRSFVGKAGGGRGVMAWKLATREPHGQPRLPST